MSHSDLKRSTRITTAKLAVKQADRYLVRYPASSAAPVVRDLRLALDDTIAELEHPTATGDTR